MAIIAGVTVQWILSPRIILIPVSETEVTVEDLQDTLLDLEWSVTGMVEPHLRNFSGGEDLGGGTSVGFTMELQDSVLGWASNVTSLETGTVTTPDTAGATLEDSIATFSSNGVMPGDMVVNSTDGSHCTVLNVVSETELSTDGLVGGTDDQFDSADAYEVFDWQLRNITGGNIVAVDDVGAPIDPIFPSFGNYVTKTSSSSATLQELTEIQNLSFPDGRVFIDPINGVAGVAYPIGNIVTPVNNLANASSIIATRGLPEAILLNGSLTLTTEDITNFDFLGNAESQDILDLGTATTTNSVFRNIKLQGTANGTIHCHDCILDSLSEFQGFLVGGAIAGTVTLAGEVHIVNVHAAATGDNTITLDYQGNPVLAFIPGWDGKMTITNHSHASAMTAIDLQSGTIVLDATCTDGTIVVRGEGDVVNNAIGATVIDKTSKKVTRVEATNAAAAFS